jgi:hypothetical protein
MAHARCMLDKQGYARTHVARARAHTHTHTEKYVILFFHGNNHSRTRLNVTFILTLPVFFPLQELYVEYMKGVSEKSIEFLKHKSLMYRSLSLT